jgi:heat shock protein HslJ
MRMLKLFAVAFAVLAPIALAACAANKGAGVNLADAIVGDWNLHCINRVPVAVPQGARVPSLSFTPDGRVSGFAGVNRVSGGFDPATLADGRLSFGPMAMTKMAGPPELMKLEDEFTQALSKVTRARIDADQLVFSSNDADLMRFNRAN